MRTALDSNVLSSLWSNEPAAKLIAPKLEVARAQGALVLSPIALAELFAHPRLTEKQLFDELDGLGIEVDFDLRRSVWVEAGRRYRLYCERRRESSGDFSKRLLADFVVGAHALLNADRLITLDVNRYVRDFSELLLLRVEE